MGLEDLKFSDEEAKRIIELTVQEEERISKVSNQDSPTPYKSLMETIKEGGLNPDTARRIIENGGYKTEEIKELPNTSRNTVEHQRHRTQSKLYRLAKENVSSFIYATIGSFLVGAGVKYIGHANMEPPLAFWINYNTNRRYS